MRKWGRIIWALLAVAAIACAIDGFWIEPRSLTLTELDVATPSWPVTTAPLRVVLLSDTHADDMHMTPARIRKIAATVNAMHPDAVILAGDYIGGNVLRGRKEFGARPMRSPKEIALDEDGLRALGAFHARYGVFAVMGNHDCWWDCDTVRRIMNEDGIHFLENQAAAIHRTDGDVWILGVEDGQTQHPDFPATFAKAPAGSATITVTHNPGLFDWPTNYVPIMLAGHTHGGQVRIPFLGAPITASRHTNDTYKGWTIIDGRVLIVTRGVGESGIPVRFDCPPQIMLLTFHNGPVAKVMAKSDKQLK